MSKIMLLMPILCLATNDDVCCTDHTDANLAVKCIVNKNDSDCLKPGLYPFFDVYTKNGTVACICYPADRQQTGEKAFMCTQPSLGIFILSSNITTVNKVIWKRCSKKEINITAVNNTCETIFGQNLQPTDVDTRPHNGKIIVGTSIGVFALAIIVVVILVVKRCKDRTREAIYSFLSSVG